MTAPYTLKVVDRAGTPYGTVDAAQNVRPVWELDGHGSLDFDVDTADPAAALLAPTRREVQLWHFDGAASRCRWWGPVWRRDPKGAVTHVQCRGLGSYLDRVQMGPVLHEYLLDPDFEDASLAHWTAVGAAQSSDTGIVRKGSRALKLVSAAQGLDNYSYQQFTVDNTGGSEALAVFARARFYIEATPASPYIGPAFKERGLYVRRIYGGVEQKAVWTPITNAAPRNQWVRAYAPAVFVPAGRSETVEVRCYSWGGAGRWDTATSRALESTGADTVDGYADVNQILRNVLAYAQAAPKTDFHITGPAGSLGVRLQRQYQFFNHGMVWPVAVRPLVDDGVCDVEVVWDESAPSTRTLTTYAHKGSASGLTITLGGNGDFDSRPEDGMDTAGAVTVIPQGMSSEPSIGPANPVADDFAYASDPTANGGVVLDRVVSALPESTLDSMASQAATELARRKGGAASPVFLLPADQWWASGASVGDTVVFDGSYGFVSEAAVTRRVVSVALMPERNLVAVTGQ